MKKWISLLLVVLTLLAFAPVAMADPITEDSVVIILNCRNSVNLRKDASTSSTKLGDVKRGAICKLLAIDGDWYKIQYNSKTGFVHKNYVKQGKKDTILKSGEAMVTYAPDGGVTIYKKAGSNKLAIAKLGDTFEVKGKSGKYTKIAYSGDTAYIKTTYLTSKGNGSGSSESITPVADKTMYIDYDTKKVKNVNVREKASSKNTPILGTLSRGAEITVTGYTSRWTRIKYAGGEAWVFSEFVVGTKPSGGGGGGSEYAGKTATIVNSRNNMVRIRAKASTSGQRLGWAANGDTFTVQGKSGNWWKVEYKGKSAYIHKNYVKIS
jgi:probable enterotoxin B